MAVDTKATEKKSKTPAQKADDFKRIGSARMHKALNTIKLIGNLANPQQYSYTPEQVKRITDALRGAVDKVDARFANPKQTGGDTFTL